MNGLPAVMTDKSDQYVSNISIGNQKKNCLQKIKKILVVLTNTGTDITDPFWADCNLGSDEANFSEEKKTDLLPTSPALLNWMIILI